VKLNKEKYSYNEYKNYYPEEYAQRKSRLRKVLGDGVLIEHVGSSAVKGLGGKGYIDILVTVDKKDMSRVRRLLIKHGYHNDTNFGSEERIYFIKKYQFKGKKRVGHVHLTFKNSKTMKAAIGVRDYLRRNKPAREKYIRLKKEGVRKAKGDGKLYRAYKNDFLVELVGRVK